MAGEGAEFDFEGNPNTHARGGGAYKDADGSGKITHVQAVDGDHNPVGDDEFEDQIDKDEQKQDLGALEAAKMAIKFLDQAIHKLRQRRADTQIQIDEDYKEISYIDKEISWLQGKQKVVTDAQSERQAARDKIKEELDRCVEGFQTVINNAKNLNRRGSKEAKMNMGRTHVARGMPHISNRNGTCFEPC